MINGKTQDITIDDALSLAKDNGISKAKTIINDVVEAVSHFRQYAERYGVQPRWISAVDTCLNDNLLSWGFGTVKPTVSYTTFTGRVISDIHVEQMYKGNFHLLGNINGIAKKYVISKNKDDHAIISRIGAANLTEDQLHLLAEKYLAR